MVAVTRPRPDTAERWQHAAERAVVEGITVRQLAGCGAWIAPSGRDAGVAYEVTPWECECQAGQFGDPICKHRAALRVRLGWISLDPEPTPPTPAVARTPEVPCHDCSGGGWVYAENRAGRLARLTCWTCDGTGVEPTTLAA